MNKELFSTVCERFVGTNRERSGIGTLAEKTSVVPRANAPRLETSTPFARFVMLGSRPSSIPV